MSFCSSCYNDTMTTHKALGIDLCEGCSQEFCMQCYHGSRFSCMYYQDTVPEVNWRTAEAYMNSNPEKLERVVRSGPRVRCAVVRIGSNMFRRMTRDGVVVKETPIAPTESCSYCGAYDRRYTRYMSAYENGFACTECANGILGSS